MIMLLVLRDGKIYFELILKYEAARRALGAAARCPRVYGLCNLS